MYDETVDLSSSEEEEEGDSSPQRRPPLPVSNSYSGTHTTNNQQNQRAFPAPAAEIYRSNKSRMDEPSSEEIKSNKSLSSKDFITPLPGTGTRPGTSQRTVSATRQPPRVLNELSASTKFPGKMADLNKSGSFDKEQMKQPIAAARKSASKSRPISAQQQRRGPPSEDDDDDETEDDYDEELNIAQIEGILRGSRSGNHNCDILSMDDSGSDSGNDFSQMFDDEFKTPNKGGPATVRKVRVRNKTPDCEGDISDDIGSYGRRSEDYAVLLDSVLEQIPSPHEAYPIPPIDDEMEMLDYLRLKNLWELQLDVQRDQIGEQVRSCSNNRGVHDYFPMYNADDYASLNVNPEIKEIFGYISQYALPPMNSQIDVKLHPFIPDYYPSVGDIDAFIKVIDPDVKDDGLGIKCLDEPAPFQSDPSVLDLRLRALAKQSSAKAVVIKKVENVGKNTKTIENWIKDISDLHRSKPSPSVHYSKPMPDIDLLIQEWPPEIEEQLKNFNLPSPELNCDLATYADIVCTLLDIPVYKSRIQSLHVLFTLFATLKQFNNQFGGTGAMDNNNMNMNNMAMGDEMEIMPSSQSLRITSNDEDFQRMQL